MELVKQRKNFMDNTVAELFAGVGGFRLGLEKDNLWKVIWANQWEPGKKSQHAFDCYEHHYGKGPHHVNEDVCKVPAESVPDHSLLVGGFPCQDYSVAATLAKGIQGKKGVLWWEIRRIVEAKRPKFILLENVDRLLKSPAKQRGRDFAVILSCLNTLGYSVEWRVINAADYGFPQRRRRVFIFATREKDLISKTYLNSNPQKILFESGFFAPAFPVEIDLTLFPIEGTISTDLVNLTNTFSSSFENSGYCVHHKFHTVKTKPLYNGPRQALRDILQDVDDESFYIRDVDLPKWQYMKGSKKEIRKTREGFEYHYTEGAIPYPDNLDVPSRTMLTSESSKNRSTHVVEDPKSGRLRILTPVECELLNGFPKDWTNTGMPQKFRYFCMGNALVVGVISILGKRIIEWGMN
jgi:DNA (cytosine-5)-methyltransferase 1